MRAGGVDVAASGVVPSGTPIATATAGDASLWLLGDHLTDASGATTHSLWVATNETTALLPFSVTLDPKDPAFYHAVTKAYDAPSVAIDEVTAIVHVRAIDYDAIDELVATGDLSASAREGVGTLDVAGTKLTWTAAAGVACVP
jgi:hypothetical protein